MLPQWYALQEPPEAQSSEVVVDDVLHVFLKVFQDLIIEFCVFLIGCTLGPTTSVTARIRTTGIEVSMDGRDLVEGIIGPNDTSVRHLDLLDHPKQGRIGKGVHFFVRRFSTTDIFERQ